MARNRRDKAGRITSSVVAVAMLCAVTYLSMPAIWSAVALVVLRIVSSSFFCPASSSAAALTEAIANAPIAAPAAAKAKAAFLPKSLTRSLNEVTSAVDFYTPVVAKEYIAMVQTLIRSNGLE